MDIILSSLIRSVLVISVMSPLLSPSPELLRLTRECEGGAIMIQRERVTNIVMGSGNCHDVMIHDTRPVMS